MAGKFDITEILDNELGEVLRGRAVYLAADSEAAAGVTPLLEVASALSGALKAGVPAQPPAAVRESLLAKAQAVVAGAPARRTYRVRRMVLRPAALIGVLLAASGGTALAANAAGPDSILYPLKQELESARTLMAVQPLDRAAVKVGEAGKRLDEIEAMVNKGKPQYVGSLLSAYDGDMADAGRLVAQAAAQGDDTSRVTGMIAATRARHDTMLAEISGKVPADVQALIQREEGNGHGPMNGSPAASGNQTGAPEGSNNMPGGAPADNPQGGMEGGNAHTGSPSQVQNGSEMEPPEPSEPAEPSRDGMEPGNGSGSGSGTLAAPAPGSGSQPASSVSGSSMSGQSTDNPDSNGSSLTSGMVRR